MSKAFTKEDDIAEEPVRARPISSLPPGAKNYLTEDGAKRLREELNRWIELERPKLAAMSTDATRDERLRVLDERVNCLQQILHSATVVPRPTESDGKVRFGAAVTVRKRNGEQEQYRIVGVDETDLDRGWVSWVSPIANALLNAAVGDRIWFRFPSGEEQLEIVSVRYDGS